ncbi:MAG TPA: nucleotidyltransferase domain-containing protein [Chloroflexota bacterium]|nr:nucleotidyltransferase domain-containing protein [Chloroflexota bacterium]
MSETRSIDTAALGEYFSSRDDVIAAYLFGSHARGRAGPLSDVDVGVLLSGTPDVDRCFEARLDITGGVMDVLHVNDVDVAVLNQVPLALRYRIFCDGVLLHCRDRRALVEFKARTVSQYLDFLPLIERHERAIFERARRGELFDGYNRHRGSLESYRRLRARSKGEAEPVV